MLPYNKANRLEFIITVNTVARMLSALLTDWYKNAL